jgi:hypothetical protein
MRLVGIHLRAQRTAKQDIVYSNMLNSNLVLKRFKLWMMKHFNNVSILFLIATKVQKSRNLPTTVALNIAYNFAFSFNGIGKNASDMDSRICVALTARSHNLARGGRKVTTTGFHLLCIFFYWSLMFFDNLVFTRRYTVAA